MNRRDLLKAAAATPAAAILPKLSVSERRWTANGIAYTLHLGYPKLDAWCFRRASQSLKR